MTNEFICAAAGVLITLSILAGILAVCTLVDWFKKTDKCEQNKDITDK